MSQEEHNQHSNVIPPCLDSEVIHQQFALIDVFRRRQRINLQKHAQLGIETPTHVLLDIQEAAKEIAALKYALRQSSLEVADLPEDEEPPELILSQGFINTDVMPPPRPTLPPQISWCFGREQEIEQFIHQLAMKRVVVITGPPGIGKTTIAAVLARRHADPMKVFWHSFREGENAELVVWYLAAFLARNGKDDIWRTLERARRKAYKRPSDDVLVAYVAQLMRGEDYLLCLDDIHMLTDTRPIAHLIQRIAEEDDQSKTAIVLTSRQQDLFGQQQTYLQGLDTSATRLLLEARGVELDHTLIAELHQRTEGNVALLMLAIDRLLAGAEPATFIAHVAEADHIENYLLRAVDAGLTDTERHIMQALAVLRDDGGTRSVIEALLDGTAVRRALYALVDRFLLTTRETAVGTEYRQHAIIQSFYYADISRSRREQFHRRAAAYFETEGRNPLRAAQHYVSAGAFAQAALISISSIRDIVNIGRAHELLRLLEQLIGQSLDHDLTIAVTLAYGEVAELLSKQAQAATAFRRVLDLLQSKPPHLDVCRQRGRACRGLAEVFERENPPEALRWLQRGEELLGAADETEAGLLKLRTGLVLIATGSYEQAMAALEGSLELLPQPPSPARAEALMNQGIVACIQSNLGRGQAAFEAALDIYKQLDDQWGKVAIWQNLATLHEVRGEWDAAVIEYHRALDLAHELGSVLREVEIGVNLGNLEKKRGDYERAHDLLMASLATAERYSLRVNAVYARVNLADLYILQGAYAQAVTTLRRVEAEALQLDVRSQLTEIYQAFATIELAHKNYEAALAQAKRALLLAQEISDPLAEGVSLRIYGQALLTSGRRADALTSFARSAELLSDEPYELARTWASWGIAVGDEPARARTLLSDAESVFTSLGAKQAAEQIRQLPIL